MRPRPRAVQLLVVALLLGAASWWASAAGAPPPRNLQGTFAVEGVRLGMSRPEVVALLGPPRTAVLRRENRTLMSLLAEGGRVRRVDMAGSQSTYPGPIEGPYPLRVTQVEFHYLPRPIYLWFDHTDHVTHVMGDSLSLDGRPLLRDGDSGATVESMLGPPNRVQPSDSVGDRWFYDSAGLMVTVRARRVGPLTIHSAVIGFTLTRKPGRVLEAPAPR